MKFIRKLIRFLTTPTPVKFGFIISVCIVVLHMLGNVAVFQTFQLRTNDFKFRARGPVEPGNKVVILTVDEKTYQTMGKWPYPRSVMADMLKKLRQYKAKVIAFDMMFTVTDQTGERFIKEIKKYYDSLPENKKLKDIGRKINEVTAKANTDQLFADEIAKTDNVVLGFAWQGEHEIYDKKQTFDLEKSLLEPGQLQMVNDASDSHMYVPVGLGVVGNIPVIEKASPYHAYFNGDIDEDGVFRRISMVSYFKGSYFAATSLVAAARYYDTNIFLSFNQIGVDFISLIEKTEIPVDSHGRFLVNYRGPSYTIPHISLVDLLDNREEISLNKRINNEIKEISTTKLEAIKDKVVLFGVTAKGVYDLRNTPFQKEYPGLEVHANVVDNILENDYIVAGNDEIEGLYALFILFGGLLFSYLLSKLNALYGFISTLALMVVYVLIDVNFIFSNGILIDLFLILFQTLILYIGITLYKYMGEERQKRQIKGAFQQYVSASIVQEMIKDPSKLKLGGEKKRLSVLFSDVRGFTSISEKLDAQALSQFLNNYLTPMTEIIIDNGGTIDKYMGDAIMAFYGAPVSQNDHAVKACNSALDMMKNLRELRKNWAAEGLPYIDIGIGINTGDMSVGNMGSVQIFDYTVMGDSVNLGSRLEGINKQYGTNIIISEFTFAEVSNKFHTREIDLVKVKGKNEPVKIYELIARVEDTHPWLENGFLLSFEQGFKLYHQQQFDKALSAFSKCRELHSDDKCSSLYIERCQQLKANPPGKDWDGIITMTTK